MLERQKQTMRENTERYREKTDRQTDRQRQPDRDRQRERQTKRKTRERERNIDTQSIRECTREVEEYGTLTTHAPKNSLENIYFSQIKNFA